LDHRPDLASNLTAPLDRILYDSLAPARIAAILLGAFACTTLLLGLVGIYGVLAYSVGQRTRELGVRLALGATAAQVLRMVLAEAARLACAGVVMGIIAAFAAVLAAALLAAFAPARHATLVDPATSLRAE
jgi:ABC-type antimicrobial peptide transport system permease subunit